MAITLRASGAWADSNATTQTVTLPTHAAGDLLIVVTAAKAATMASLDATTATGGWNRLTPVNNGTTAAGVGTGSVEQTIFYKEATSSAETNPVISWGTTSAPGLAVAQSWQKSSTEQWVIPVHVAGSTNAATAISVTMPSNPGLLVNDVGIGIHTTADDSALTVPTWTATGTTLNTVTVSPATPMATATSNDMAATMCYRTVTAGSASAAPVVTGTQAAAETGITGFIRLRVTPTFTANAVLYPANPSDIYGQAVYTDRPVAWWRLGEASGTVVDTIGRSNGATTGTVTRDVTGLIASHSDDGAIQPAASGYVSGTLGQAIGNVFTIEMWVKLPASGTTTICPFSTKGSVSNISMEVARSASTPGFMHRVKGFIYDGATYDTVAESGDLAVAAGGTYHIVWTRAGTLASQNKIYINSVDQGVTPGVTQAVVNTDTTFYIGGFEGTAETWTNTIDEVAVYNTALSSTQVTAHYNAGLANTINGNFTADAVLLKTISGSATADAVLRGTVNGSATADSVLMKTQSGSFTADAALRMQPVTFTADAVLKATLSGSVTADSILKNTVSGSVVADSILKKNVSATITADAVLKGTIAGSVTADAVLMKPVQASVTADSILRKNVSASVTGDAVLKRVESANFSADSLLLRVESSSITADSIIKRTESQSFTADSYMVSRVGQTFTADAVLKIPGGDFTADAILKRVESSTFTADSVLRKTVSPTVSADAVLQATQTGSATADALLLKVVSDSIAANSVLRKTISGSITADAITKRVETGSFSAEALLLTIIQTSFTADSVIAPHTFTADAVLAPVGAVLRSFTADAILMKVSAYSFDANAVLRGSTSATVDANAVLRKASTGSVTADAILRNTVPNSVTANAVIQRTESQTFTADAVLEAETFVIEGSFSADALLVASSTKNFTADAVLSGTSVQTFTANAWISSGQTDPYIVTSSVDETLQVNSHVEATVENNPVEITEVSVRSRVERTMVIVTRVTRE